MMWSYEPLFNVVRFVGGGTPSKANPAFWSGEIPWVSPKDMISRDVQDSQDHITEEAIELSATQLIPTGSVIIVVRSGILVRRLPVGIVRRPVTLNQDMKALIPAVGGLDGDFIAYFLESREGELLTNCVKRGATVHSLDTSKLKQVKIPLPSLSEQRHIVKLLDQANALRRKRTTADDRTARFLPALFIKMFGDPATNPMGWKPSSVGELIEEPQFGLSTALSGKTEQYEGMLPVLRIANISNDGYLKTDDLRFDKVSDRKRQELLLQPGDLLFNWRNSPNLVGKTAIFNETGNYIFASFLFRLKVKKGKATNYFLWFYLNRLRQQGWFETKCRQAVSQANFGRDELCAIKLPLPPFELQGKFSEHVDRFNKIREYAANSRQKLDAMFSTLLHHAFSGKLTEKWREAHMKDLLAEMEVQKKELDHDNNQKALSF